MTKDMTNGVLITRDGLRDVRKELDFLSTVKRAEVSEDLRNAIERGGTKDNAEYENAKNKQAFIEGRIRQLEHVIRNAVIMDILHKPRNVCFGSHVKVCNEEGKIEQFTIVGPFETSPRTGKISYESPLGKALLGKSVSDAIVVATPLGPAKYVIEDIF